MQRRNFMSHVSAGVAGVGVAACGGGNADSGPRNPTFVFVHGAWHGSWCWAETVRLLAEKGYLSIALDLPGHGLGAKFPASYATQSFPALNTEASPLAAIGLNDYREHTLKTLRGLVAAGSGPVILVGHSLGGATITNVAEAAPELIRKIVYLTAFVPVPGRFAVPSVIQYIQDPIFAASEVPPLFIADPAVGAGRINHNSADAKYVAADRSAFYGDATDDAFKAVANLLTPDEPVQGFANPVTATVAKWGSVQKAFIRCTKDKAIPISVQDIMIAEGNRLTSGNLFQQKTLVSDHSPFVTQPQNFVDTLISLV